MKTTGAYRPKILSKEYIGAILQEITNDRKDWVKWRTHINAPKFRGYQILEMPAPIITGLHVRAQVPGLPNIGNASPHHHWAPRKVKFCIYILTWETDFKYLPFTSRDSLALKEVHNQLGHKQITDFISTD